MRKFSQICLFFMKEPVMHLNGFFVKALQCDVTGSVPERTGINFTQKIFSLNFDGLIDAKQ